MNRWITDLLLGVRLAVGGGRNSWIRLALTGLGIGLGVAVLLVASAFPSVLNARDDRAALLQSTQREPIAGVDPLYRAETFNEYRAEIIKGSYLKAGGPNAPVPPGAERIPGDGEILLSPDLAKLLASPEGELLRPRFPQRVIGTIGQQGLEGPYELRFYAGDAAVESTPENAVYAFGAPRFGQTINPLAYTMGIVFVAILLFPVFVFVGISTRIAGAERDRRLAALRLVGASAHRVRRIAAGESLIGAVVGLVVGFALFFYLRQYTESVRLARAALFRSDLTPSLPLVVLVVLVVPALAVATSMFALRRTIIEPLGVVREVRPVQRMLWWRLVPIIAGIGLLVSQIGTIGRDSSPNEYVLASGVVALMLGIPLLLPWLVERSVGHLHGGSPSWQLAIRRLELDSGAAARVVGGVAVVLAGAIALQTILAAGERSVVGDERAQGQVHHLNVSMTGDATPEGLAQARGVRGVHRLEDYRAQTDNENNINIAVGDCAALGTELNISNCRDGSVYWPNQDYLRGGERITFIQYDPGADELRKGGTWTVPLGQRASVRGSGGYDLYVTPSVLRNVKPGTKPRIIFHVELDPAVPDAAEHARNAVAPLRWRAHTYFSGQSGVNEAEQVFTQVRRALLGAAVLVLVLVAASLLVMALEQIRERRRPLAVLVATGVPRRVLARSVLWQNALPLLLGLLVAVATGAGLGALLLKVLDLPVVLDWVGVASLTAATAVAVLVVTLLTLPSLRRATGATGLRAE